MGKENINYNNLETKWNGNIYIDNMETKYYGAISINNTNYIIVKITSILIDEDNDKFIGDFIVREAIHNLNIEGYNIIYINEEENKKTKIIESYINKNKDKINNIESIIKESDYIEHPTIDFPLPELNKNVVTLVMNKEAFLGKKIIYQTVTKRFQK